MPDFSIPGREKQRNLKTGTDDMDVTVDSVLAFYLVLLGAQHSLITPSRGKTNAIGAITNGVFQRGRWGSDPQSSDRHSKLPFVSLCDIEVNDYQ